MKSEKHLVHGGGCLSVWGWQHGRWITDGFYDYIKVLALLLDNGSMIIYNISINQ